MNDDLKIIAMITIICFGFMGAVFLGLWIGDKIKKWQKRKRKDGVQ